MIILPGIYGGNPRQSLICPQLGSAYDVHTPRALPFEPEAPLTGPRAAGGSEGEGPSARIRHTRRTL